jgi:hypothetical protein
MLLRFICNANRCDGPRVGGVTRLRGGVAKAQVEYPGGRRHDFLGCMSREIRDEVLETGAGEVMSFERPPAG